MTPRRDWARVRTLFHAALDAAVRGARSRSCRRRHDDADVRRRGRVAPGGSPDGGGVPEHAPAGAWRRLAARRAAPAPGARLGAFEIVGLIGDRAAWARCIARATRGSIATSRSRCSRPTWRTIRTAASASSAKRARLAAHPSAHLHAARCRRGDDRRVGRAFLVMELRRRRDAGRAACAAARCRSRRRSAVAIEIAEALVAAHARGHRPSRSQAGQHHADAVGREAARLRARPADARSPAARRTPPPVRRVPD